MNKLKDMRTVEDVKEFIYLHKDLIKKAALPFTVVAAVLIFWIFSMSNGSSVKEGHTGSSASEYGESRMESESAEAGKSGERYGDLENSSHFPGFNSTENSKGAVSCIYVDISGCVENPGVYEVNEGTRLFQLIEKAGGLTPGADTEGINRAEKVSDGQKIVIYEEGENPQNHDMVKNGTASSEIGSKININTADESLLQDIPGIGPVTADSIIKYREENGSFSSIEDIKNVSGIGDKTFEKLKDRITV